MVDLLILIMQNHLLSEGIKLELGISASTCWPFNKKIANLNNLRYI